MQFWHPLPNHESYTLQRIKGNVYLYLSIFVFPCSPHQKVYIPAYTFLIVSACLSIAVNSAESAHTYMFCLLIGSSCNLKAQRIWFIVDYYYIYCLQTGMVIFSQGQSFILQIMKIGKSKQTYAYLSFLQLRLSVSFTLRVLYEYKLAASFWLRTFLIVNKNKIYLICLSNLFKK